jgi:transposase-like protein
MAKPTAESPKRHALRQRGTLNPRAPTVTDPLFQHRDFFDPDDLVQVKYELLRRVDTDRAPVTDAAKAFGVSRATFYQARTDFQAAGLPGLVPEKRGPRGAHKLTPTVLDFVRQQRAGDPALTADALAARIRSRWGVQVHPRSLARALQRHQKKR